jgi:hypothetical protein
VQVKHSFHLNNGKGNPWVTLNVMSKARSPDQAPTFVEGDAIVGSAELDSQTSQIQEMDVFVSNVKLVMNYSCSERPLRMTLWV